MSAQERFEQQAQIELTIAKANTQLIHTLQAIKARASRYQSTTSYQLTGPLPQMMIHESDTHYGHLASDQLSWETLYAYVMETPGVFLGFYGDILEGFNPDHVDSNNQIALEPTEQILSFQDEYLRNLSAADKIVHMIGMYTNSHLRAAVKKANIDPYPLLTHSLPIPLLYNGSIFDVTRGEHRVAFRGFHNPPAGGRSTNPTGGLDTAELQMPGYADHVLAGHLHTLGNAVAATKRTDGKIQYRYSLGARKGRNTGGALPDRFAVSTNGGKISGPAGAATIFYETPQGEREYGIGDVELAKTLLQASSLYTRILDRGKEDELRARVMEQLEQKPALEIVESKSKKRKEDLDEQEKSGLVSWKKLSYTITTHMPLLLMFASGLRLGSELADTKKLKEVTDLVTSNPHAFLFCLRQMIDQNVPQHANREEVVSQLVKLLKPAWKKNGKNNQVLGWLFDGIMRYEYWKDPKVLLPNGAYADPNGFMPASYISNETGVPLVDNQAEVILSLKNGKRANTQYRLRLFDVAGNPKNSFSGMLANEMINGFNVEGEEHDLLVGNNSTTGGWLQRSNPKIDKYQTVVSPGWMAHEHTVGGKRARGVPSPGGYGAILLPHTEKVIPVSDVDEARYWHAALFFLLTLPKITSMEKIHQELQTPRK